LFQLHRMSKGLGMYAKGINRELTQPCGSAKSGRGTSDGWPNLLIVKRIDKLLLVVIVV